MFVIARVVLSVKEECKFVVTSVFSCVDGSHAKSAKKREDSRLGMGASVAAGQMRWRCRSKDEKKREIEYWVVLTWMRDFLIEKVF